MNLQVAYRWKYAWIDDGKPGLANKGKADRNSRLTYDQTNQVIDALVEDPGSRGYRTNLWALSPVAALIKELTGVK